MAQTLTQLLEDFLQVKAYPKVNPETDTVGTTPVTILRNNPNRVAWVIVNLSLNDVFILPAEDPSATKGIRLGPSGGSASANWLEDMELVAWEWKAVASGAGSAILVLEVATTS